MGIPDGWTFAPGTPELGRRSMSPSSPDSVDQDLPQFDDTMPFAYPDFSYAPGTPQQQSDDGDQDSSSSNLGGNDCFGEDMDNVMIVDQPSGYGAQLGMRYADMAVCSQYSNDGASD